MNCEICDKYNAFAGDLSMLMKKNT